MLSDRISLIFVFSEPAAPDDVQQTYAAYGRRGQHAEAAHRQSPSSGGEGGHSDAATLPGHSPEPQGTGGAERQAEDAQLLQQPGMCSVRRVFSI